jgi:hypothetical protein
MKIIDIKIKKATILLPNLKEEEITSYKIIYKEKSKEKTFKMWTFDKETKPFTEYEFIQHFKKQNKFKKVRYE